MPDRTALVPLATLRYRLAAWYVGTYAIILLLLGGGLFLVVARQVRRELDASLASAVDALVRGASQSQETDWQSADARLRMPGFSLYLFDADGHPVLRDTASGVAREAARAARLTPAVRQLPNGAENVSRAYARSFVAPDGRTFVAAAVADLEDLEDRYTRLIGQFTAAAVLALALVALGGMFLAHKSSAPVEAVVEQMRRFMADASHELRTPVAVLRTEAEVALARVIADPDDRRAFEVIASEAARLGTVVEDLLILARGEATEQIDEREPLFLDDLVSDAVSAFGTLAAQRRVSLTLAEFQEAPVRGSAVLLRRLLSAVIENAIKYTPAGGSIAVAVRTAAGRVTVSVTDTGMGIGADALPRVFDRFYRSDSARASTPGTGLGLPIAQWIASAHGGELTLASALGAGTTATLRLPRRP